MTGEDISGRRLRYWENPWFRYAVFGMVALVYLVNRSPYVGFNDGLSFLYEAAAGWSPYTNATSHFLYNNLQHLLLTVFFFLPHVLVLTLFSIACSLGALWRVYGIAKRFTGGMPTALMPVVILGLSFTFWQQTEIIEVYAFNNFVFLSFLYHALEDLHRGRRDRWWRVSLWMGIGLLTHIQHLLSLPFFLYYIFSGNVLNGWKKAAGLGIAAGLFAVLFLPPLLADTNSISAIFFDNRFRGAVTGFDAAALAKGALMAMAFLAYNFHVFLLFILYGWYLMYRERRSLFWWLLLLFLPYFGFGIKYNVNDNHVFFLVSYLVFVLPSAFSFAALALKLMRHMNWILPVTLLMGPALYAMAAWMGSRMPQLEAYAREKAYKGGVVHLLWPGKSMAKDPLKLAAEIRETGPGARERGAVEWNYPAAVRYLELREGD